MKIYFAGSIRGGREDQELYYQIIEILKKYGMVLTEHVANKNVSSYGEKLDEATIFNRDIDWLNSSNVVVAEITTPSLGVGYELGWAVGRSKPILCIYREHSKHKPSAMILGNSQITVIKYNRIEDLKTVFNKFFTNLK